MTQYVRPVSRLAAMDLSASEIEAVSGGGPKSGNTTNTSTVTSIQDGGFTVDDSHND